LPEQQASSPQELLPPESLPQELSLQESSPREQPPQERQEPSPPPVQELSQPALSLSLSLRNLPLQESSQRAAPEHSSASDS
jgi:hypothetical protein